jgi:hypothetical protein
MILYGKDAEIRFLTSELDKLHKEKNGFGNYLRGKLADPNLPVWEHQLYDNLYKIFWNQNS